MMDRHTACPECDSYDTEVVDTQFYRDMIERVWTPERQTTLEGFQ